MKTEKEFSVKYRFYLAAVHLLNCILFSFNIANATFHSDLCRLFKSKTTLRYPDIYNAYIKCEKNELHICDDKESAYDPKQGKCIKYVHQNRCLQPKTCKLMANPIDCSSFYFCANGLTYSTDCEKNYHFDEENQMCVPPENSKCIAGVNNICELIANGTRFVDPKDSTKFYECENDKQTRYSCGTTNFNVELGECEHKSTVNSKFQPPTKFPNFIAIKG